jgi:hypothetical protein
MNETKLNTNRTRLLFIEVKPILIEIKEKCPYPINHQDIENYQQEVRHLLKLKKITNKGDVYACQVALHVNINDFTTWQEINDFYTTDYEQNKIQFYPLIDEVAKCVCGQDCIHRFRFTFNEHYLHVGCICINKDEIVCSRFKQYKNKVNRIYKLLVSYYKYVLYSTFKRFKFYKSKTILLKYTAYKAFQKWKSKPIQPKLIHLIQPKGCVVCSKPSGIYPRCVSCEIEYKKINKDKCRCGKYKDKKYKICYTCKNCVRCNGSGIMYLSDDVECSCYCTGKPFE